MTDKKYYVTQEQLEALSHLTSIFDAQAEYIHNLCSEERDDVVYGFELGKIYSAMREHFIESNELVRQLWSQDVTAPPQS